MVSRRSAATRLRIQSKLTDYPSALRDHTQQTDLTDLFSFVSHGTHLVSFPQHRAIGPATIAHFADLPSSISRCRNLRQGVWQWWIERSYYALRSRGQPVSGNVVCSPETKADPNIGC